VGGPVRDRSLSCQTASFRLSPQQVARAVRRSA